MGELQRWRHDVDTNSESANRDVIVVGASAGGVEATRRLAAALPADLPATLFVVVHRGPDRPGYLAEILGAAGPLPAMVAEEGAPFVRGRIYVAPPDLHLLVGRDHVHVRRGPRENRVRPAIDPLFRSAAVHCSTRVVGVVLTGLLDDGTSGLQAIRRCGGVAVAQDPRDADFKDMPLSAVRHGAADHVLALDRMPDLLSRLARGPRPPAVEPPANLRMEALIAAQELSMDPDQKRLGELSPLTCPECHGSLYEIHDGTFLRFRCHTGHAFTAEALRSEQGKAWERALYDALRAQEEQAALLRRMAGDARQLGAARQADDFALRARSYEEGAQIIRGLLSRANGEAEPEREPQGSAA
jgi:two-component system chemotaxis response regulator CheB